MDLREFIEQIKSNDYYEFSPPTVLPDDLQMLGYGRHRITFKLSDKYVLKVPYVEDGVYDNHQEVKLYNRFREAGKCARCRIVKLYNLPCLIMEMVTPFVYGKTPGEDWPEWSNYVDCGQVGVTRKGNVVAYDYADSSDAISY